MEKWQYAARNYLSKLRTAEYNANMRKHLKTRKASTFKCSPSQYYFDLLEKVNADDEEGFKAIKMLQGYNSELSY